MQVSDSPANGSGVSVGNATNETSLEEDDYVYSYGETSLSFHPLLTDNGSAPLDICLRHAECVTCYVSVLFVEHRGASDGGACCLALRFCVRCISHETCSERRGASNRTTPTISDYGPYESARLVQVTLRPVLVAMGTTGNALSFWIMTRSSLRNISTCFFLAMLAVADTGAVKQFFAHGRWTCLMRMRLGVQTYTAIAVT